MSPHFNLTKSDYISDRKGFLLERSQIHFRTAKFLLLEKNKIQHGYSTLFDSLISAFELYIMINKDSLPKSNVFDITDYLEMYQLLEASNILKFNFEFYDKLLDDILEKRIDETIDYSAIIEETEEILTKLGVCPFDESQLPPIQHALY